MKSIQDDFCFKGMCQGKFEKKKGKKQKRKNKISQREKRGHGSNQKLKK